MKTLNIVPGPDGFAEDKDEARRLRNEKLLPILERGGKVVLNFEGVNSATQSFVHALVGEALQRYGEDVLERIEFRNCSRAVRSVIELVVDYSLAGFPEQAV